MISRRKILAGTAATFTVGGAFALTRKSTKAISQPNEQYEVSRTTAQWQALLTTAQFSVLRQEGTERAYTSALLQEKRVGAFLCGACDLPVYRSETKYESGTGWPSFYASIKGAVLTKTDYKAIYPRTEVHCRRCGSHFGHIFNDGPKPTGKRHCLNGIALKFAADA